MSKPIDTRKNLIAAGLAGLPMVVIALVTLLDQSTRGPSVARLVMQSIQLAC